MNNHRFVLCTMVRGRTCTCSLVRLRDMGRGRQWKRKHWEELIRVVLIFLKDRKSRKVCKNSNPRIWGFRSSARGTFRFYFWPSAHLSHVKVVILPSLSSMNRRTRLSRLNEGHCDALGACVGWRTSHIFQRKKRSKFVYLVLVAEIRDEQQRSFLYVCNHLRFLSCNPHVLIF